MAFGAFLVTAVTASQLSAYARRRAAEAEARRLEIERLYALVQAMMLTGNARKTIREFVHRVVQVFGCGAAAFYYSPTGDIVRSGPESAPVTDHDAAWPPPRSKSRRSIRVTPRCHRAGAAGRPAAWEAWR